jgi:4-hydroxybenzoyl-CoA reductase subunit beta
MNLPPFNYLEPLTLKEALSMLNKYRSRVKIVAGGTEITNHLKSKNLTPSFILTLRKISGLHGIKENKNEVVIGSYTTLKEIHNSSVIRKKFKSIADSASYVAAPPIQNRATVGGNILQNTRCMFYNQSEFFLKGLTPCYKRSGKVCHAVKGSKRCFSVYQGDMAPILIALDAKIILEKKGKARKLPLSDLFTSEGTGPFSIGNDELLTKIIMPIPKGNHSSAYEKMRVRGSLEYPFASVAVSLEMGKNGHIAKARVVIGAAGSSPKSIEETALYFTKTWPKESDIEIIGTHALEASEMVNNLSMPALYRRKMVKVLTKRAVKRALKDLKRGT